LPLFSLLLKRENLVTFFCLDDGFVTMLGAVASAPATLTFTELGSNKSPAWAGTISYPFKRTICTFIDARTSINARERIATVGRSHRRGFLGEGCRSKGRAAWDDCSSTAVDDLCLGYRKRCAFSGTPRGMSSRVQTGMPKSLRLGRLRKRESPFFFLYCSLGSPLSAPTRR